MKKDFTIRLLENEELEPALAIVWGVFLKYVAPEFDKNGVDEFHSFIDPTNIRSQVDNNQMLIWGCFDENQIIGVMALKTPSHISLTFVDDSYHHQGIARSLFSQVTDYCKNNCCEKITVNSSSYAVPVYSRLNFKATGDQQKENGISYIPMEFVLN